MRSSTITPASAVRRSGPLPLSGRRWRTAWKPAVDRREEVAGFGAPALVAAEPGEARSDAQFPELGLLLLGDAQGFARQFQTQPTRRVLLPEDDVLLAAVERPPGADAALHRMPAPISGWRRRISSKMAIGRRPGVLFSSGTTSLSQTGAGGSRRRRSRGAFFCEGSRWSCSTR